MFFGFWIWVLIIIVIGCIFYAKHLPDVMKLLEDKMKYFLDAAKKGKQDLNSKLNEAKKKREAEAAKKKTEVADFEKEEDE